MAYLFGHDSHPWFNVIIFSSICMLLASTSLNRPKNGICIRYFGITSTLFVKYESSAKNAQTKKPMAFAAKDAKKRKRKQIPVFVFLRALCG